MKSLEITLANTLSKNFGLLILRLSISVLMLFHGIAKVLHGIDGIKKGVIASGFPEMLAYGVYLGEILAPILLIFGLFTRISALLMAGTMVFAIMIAHSHEFFILNKFGAPVIELPLLYLFIGLTLVFTGAGKYSLDEKLK